MVFGIGKRLEKRKEKKELTKKIFEEEVKRVEKRKKSRETVKIRATARTSATIAGAGVPTFAAKRIGGGVTRLKGVQADIKFIEKEFKPIRKKPRKPTKTKKRKTKRKRKTKTKRQPSSRRPGLFMEIKGL